MYWLSYGFEYWEGELMQLMKTVFDACYSIMSLPVPLFEYRVTLWQLFVFGTLAFCVVRAVFGLFK